MRVFFAVSCVVAACTHPSPQSPQPAPTLPKDLSPHHVQMIPVASGVTLEVLDFGGEGPPLVLLSGLGSTAHIYDDLAPRLAVQHHVWAITRRGFGASSQPSDGYDLPTRVADDLAVLDALKLNAAIWVGHSIAGNELTLMGAQHADRVTALVYLDAAYDQTALKALGEPPPEPPPPQPTSEELASFAKFHSHINKLYGFDLPVGEVLALFRFDDRGHALGPASNGDSSAKVMANTVTPDYDAVKPRALVIFAPAPSMAQLIPDWQQLAPDALAAAKEWVAKWQASRTEQIQRVNDHLRGVEVVQFLTGDHAIFITNADQVLAEMTRFSRFLQRAPNRGSRQH